MYKTAGIIGFGRFGKILRSIIRFDFDIRVFDPTDPITSPLKEAVNSDIIFLCMPIDQLESVLSEIKDMIKPGALVIDVCSVKVEPSQLMDKYLPNDVDILPSHPMFGPDSAKSGFKGLSFVLCPYHRTSEKSLSFMENYLKKTGFVVVKMSCEEHDRTTAYSLCVTQLVGRLLGELNLTHSSCDTTTFRQLLHIRNVAMNDSLELFLNLQRKNPYAKEMRDLLSQSLDKLKSDITVL